ncbi:cleavage system H protein [Seminavis robusta]|uniref:Glycine cleavage system H protein n=1 Tax=Seminavis robusta TaxID=568900 RepID=A0A9N8HA93_9STRA|nr:cleavage system H protein [Seminavis robusta]|eukprot:Sro216_g089410.1 cleavage system H protein (160) ;mRNA; f:52498-53193
MATLFARSVARTSVGSALRSSKVVSASSRLGVVRLTSYFTPAHEYVKVEGNIGTVGITDFAQSALGDIVFVDLPEVDDDFEKGDSFGSVESVKAASDVYAPVAGKVIETNDNISDDPGLVNTAAETDAWFIKLEISDASELDGLMDEAAYKEHCDKEAH